MESPIAEKNRDMEVESTNKASSSDGTVVELTGTSNSEESSNIVKTKKMGNLFENLVRNHQNSLKALFQRKRSSDGEGSDSPEPLPFLSPLANSVVSRSSRILKTSPQELQHRFDTELPESVRQQSEYARNFLEFCSFETLDVMTRGPDYLGDKEFRRLMFDMMLAWEIPGSESEKLDKELTPLQEIDDGDGWSLFYSSSTNTALQVDDKNYIGQDAFARIAPGCAAIADAITVHNLFDALTVSSGRRLHFLIYDKYLRSLDKIIKAAKNAIGPSVSYLQLAEGEMILDIDGTVPTQPVFQHIGISAWPGRLTLTNYAIYFEALGVGVYDKCVRYDLANDLKQVIKPELTGPLGARIFDKAVMYKSTSVTEPVFMEFPEFKGKSRRDYWLDICLEILRAHKFSRKNGFKEVQLSEVIARATLGIFRCRAVREAFNFFSSQYKSLLAFNLAESLPGGDIILETLSSRLLLIYTGSVDGASSPYTKHKKILSPVSVAALSQLGFSLLKRINLVGLTTTRGDISVGEVNPFEIAVKKSILDTGRAEAAQATVDQVKVEGIDTNLAVMKELMLPVIQTVHRLQVLASWESPFRSMIFLALVCLLIYLEWIKYVVPCIFVYIAVVMLWRRVLNRGKSLDAFKIRAPPSRNAVEQLLTLQDSIGQMESLIQAGNIVLLKIRALMFAIVPKATEKVAVVLVVMGVVLAVVPLKLLFVIGFFEGFTREMPLRKESSDRCLRRLREWWVRIPAAPVQLLKDNDKKNK